MLCGWFDELSGDSFFSPIKFGVFLLLLLSFFLLFHFIVVYASKVHVKHNVSEHLFLLLLFFLLFPISFGSLIWFFFWVKKKWTFAEE